MRLFQQQDAAPSLSLMVRLMTLGHITEIFFELRGPSTVAHADSCSQNPDVRGMQLAAVRRRQDKPPC